MSRINDYIISKRDKGIPKQYKQLPPEVVAKQSQVVIMVQDRINENTRSIKK